MYPLLFAGKAAGFQQKTNAIVCNDSQLKLTQNFKNQQKWLEPNANFYRPTASNVILQFYTHNFISSIWNPISTLTLITKYNLCVVCWTWNVNMWFHQIINNARLKNIKIFLPNFEKLKMKHKNQQSVERTTYESNVREATICKASTLPTSSHSIYQIPLYRNTNHISLIKKKMHTTFTLIGWWNPKSPT